MIIYKVTNKINNKIYIGLTTYSLSHRKGQHYQDCKRINSKFCNALKKYNKEDFIWEIIENCSSIEDMINKEIEYIKKFDSIKKGYNLREGGEGGGKHSNESKIKSSLSKKGNKHPLFGKKRPKEWNEKMVKTRKNNGEPWFKKDTIEKISKSLKGKTRSLDIKEKMKSIRNERPLGIKYKNKEKKFIKFCTLCNNKYKAADIRSKICDQCKEPKKCLCGCGKLVKTPGRYYMSNGCKIRGKNYLEIYGVNKENIKCGFKPKIK